MLSKDQWQAEEERREDERQDDQQQDDEYRRWLDEPEAQAEYCLDMMASMSKAIDEFFSKLEKDDERTS